MEIPMEIPMESRQSLRLSSPCVLKFSGYQLLGEGSIVNLSNSGWLINSRQPLQPGTPLLLQVYLPDCPEPMDVELAIVQWSHGELAGLKNFILGNEARTRLNRYILQNANLSDVQSLREQPFRFHTSLEKIA